MVRFIHITDTHFALRPEDEVQGVNPYRAAEALVRTINNLPFDPDFIIHTGDIATDFGEAASYTQAKSVFSALRAPLYLVSGNHDVSEHIKNILPLPPVTPLTDDPKKLAYVFEKNSIRFVVLDAALKTKVAVGTVPGDQLSALSRLLADGKKTVIFIHYPALPLDSVWLDEQMLLTNGQELHTLLKRHAKAVQAVFMGHVHHPMCKMEDGVLYISGGSSFLQFDAWPTLTEATFDRPPVGFYSLVTISSKSVLTKQMWFDLPI